MTAPCDDAVPRPPDPATAGSRWTGLGDPVEAAPLAARLGVVPGLRVRPLTRKNPLLPLSALASALPAAAALYVPFPRSVLETEPPGWSGTGIALTCAPAGFLAARPVRTAFRQPCPAGTDRASGLP